MSDADPRVVVAVLTYRRPAELTRLLPMLVQHAATLRPCAEVLIVDNDPAGSAKEQIEAFRPAYPDDAVSVRYVHESSPGIAAARNRALTEADGRAGAIVFIDDDETPGDDWLALLVAQWRAAGSAAVAGPSRQVFDGAPDPWVVGSRVFDRRTAATGASVPWAGSGNLLLDLRQIRDLGLTFDDRYGLTGGSDTMFTRTLVARGGVITWCDEAEVCEPVPAARSTRRWVMRRTFRLGNGRSRIRLDLAPTAGARARVRIAAHGTAAKMVARGAQSWLHGAATASAARRGYGACRLTGAVGVLSGAYGHLFTEYRRKG